MTPQRIQRQRRKGWRMPSGAVYVGRPTKWGNPFSVEKHGRDLSLALYRNVMRGVWDPALLSHLSKHEYVRTYSAMQLLRGRFRKHPTDVARIYLRGKDLACWCPLDQPCHADILLELANNGAVAS